MKHQKCALTLLLALLLSTCLVACGSQGASSPSSPPQTENPTVSGTPAPAPTPTPAPTPAPPSMMTEAEFQEVLSQLPVTVEETDYVVQDEKYKSLYPDMLQAVIANHTDADIKDAVVAFAGWDKNHLPVKLKGSIDFSDGAYIKEVKYSDINLIPSATYGESSGFEIDEKCGVASFQAVVVSFVTFNGETWENPYYSTWRELYEGVKYTDSLTADVTVVDASFSGGGDSGAAKPESVGETELLAELEGQPVRVISTQYVVQDEKYKNLYPDMLQAVITNETDLDIKNAVVAFAGWDKNSLPIKLKGSIDFSDGTYIKEVSYTDINLVPGDTFGESSGFEIDQNCGVETFKAIVVSYEAFDGTTWNNPCYKDWCQLYEGVKLG